MDNICLNDNLSDMQNQLTQFIQELALKFLKTTHTGILDEDTILLLNQNYKNNHTMKGHINFIQILLSYLTHQLEVLMKVKHDNMQQIAQEILTEDYQILEEAMQKSQAEVRKHIKIEQQCKIYIDGLEEQVESLQKQLGEEQNKNLMLMETIKSLQRQKRNHENQQSKLDIQTRKKESSIHEAKLNNQIYKDAMVSWKYKRSKSRLVNDRSKNNIINKSIGNKLESVDNVNLIRIDNKLSFKNQNEKTALITGGHLKCRSINKLELIKTVQMKQPIAQKKISKNIKYKSQLNYQNEAKLYRSNSVCN